MHQMIPMFRCMCADIYMSASEHNHTHTHTQQSYMQACICNGFSFSFICCNWKIIQATSGGINKELMKGEGESLKAIKRERLWWRWHHGDTEETSTAAACVCGREKEGVCGEMFSASQNGMQFFAGFAVKSNKCWIKRTQIFFFFF